MTWEPKSGISLEIWYGSSLSLNREFIWLIHFLLTEKKPGERSLRSTVKQFLLLKRAQIYRKQNDSSEV